MQDYRGHVNEITHGLRFYVDPTDSLIFAGKLDHFLIALISEKYMTCMKFSLDGLGSDYVQIKFKKNGY